ncbi:MAG: hypothetical protein ACRYHQ_04035 [Janthinobacterium lividum]
MSGLQQGGAATPFPTVRQLGETSAGFARMELDAQERRDDTDGPFFTAWEAAAAATLSLPATSIEEVMILAALARGAVTDLSSQLQFDCGGCLIAPSESAQRLEERIKAALTSIVQALHDLTGTPLAVAGADFDWHCHLVYADREAAVTTGDA